MDLFEIPEDYKPEHPMSEAEINQTTEYLKNHPLFMKQLPKDISSNPHLEALQNIIYDDQPEVLAERFNKQGNQRLKENPNNLYFMKDAYKKYTEGIQAGSKDAATNAKLHCNRASINLKIKNYGKVIEDCKSALKYEPNYAKAYYRWASALRCLKRYPECLQLIKDRKQPETIQLRKQVEEEYKKEQEKQTKKQQAVNVKKSQLQTYLTSKGYKMKKRQQPLPTEAKVRIVQGRLSVPIVLIYLQFNQFDLVQNSKEDELVYDHVFEVVRNGLPWDKNKNYTYQNLQAYVEVGEAIMARIDPKASIESVLKKYVMPQCLQINILSRTSKYYEKFNHQWKVVEL